MSFSTPIGILAGIAIVLWSLFGEVKNTNVFFNVHSMGIVLGGTLATALVCLSFSQLRDIFMVLLKQFTGERKRVRIEVIKEIVRLSLMIKNGETLDSEVNEVKIPFLKEGLELYLDGSFSKDELIEILEKRIEVQNSRFRREGMTFKVIGKFPPAFGLIGATLGMIGLLQGLGAPNAFEQLGPAMSVALTSTFWGLVLANVVLLPLGENLHLAAEEDLIIREIVIDGVLLLKDKKHPLLVQENLNSYLAPKDRLNIYEGK
jgi:chemotaxis protein MotA